MNWPDDIEELCGLLRKDGIVLLPTDTIWGLCCDATNPVAIHRIRHLKQLDQQEGMVVLVADLPMLKSLVGELHPRLETLLSLHRRPLTVVYAQALGLPDILKGEQGRWAIRITAEPFLQDLIRELGHPLVAAAPHLPGEEPPLHFGAISSAFLEKVDYIARWRRNEKKEGEISVIVELDAHQELVFLRH